MTTHDRLREIEEQVAGHTPGPWRADGIVCWTTNKSTERYGGWVFGDDIFAEEADSALIAAAPDLLRIARELEAERDDLKHRIRSWVGVARKQLRGALVAERERDEWQDMCTEAQAQLSAARSERDDWQRRAETAEANLDYYRNGYQGSCMACEPVAEKNRKLEAERDEWQRRAEAAERLLDIADDHATASLAEYAASDAYYGDLLRRAVEALDKSVTMAGVYDSEVDATIAEIREHLGEGA